MKRFQVLVLQWLVVLAITPTVFGPPVFAQRPGGTAQLPIAGKQLPDVTAYDEFGNEFSTSSLRGSYSVLVFGCLT